MNCSAWDGDAAAVARSPRCRQKGRALPAAAGVARSALLLFLVALLFRLGRAPWAALGGLGALGLGHIGPAGLDRLPVPKHFSIAIPG